MFKKKYLHRIVGIYRSAEAADFVRQQLLGAGLLTSQIRVIQGLAGAGEDGQADSDDVLKDVLRDGAIGTAIGTAAGTGISLALAAANLTVFIAAPLVYMLGWGASLGGLLGAMVGAQNEKKGDLSSLIKEALASGQVVLVVHTVTEEETTLARQIVTEFIDPPVAGAVGQS